MNDRRLELEQYFEMDYGTHIIHKWIFWYSDGEFEYIKQRVEK